MFLKHPRVGKLSNLYRWNTDLKRWEIWIGWKDEYHEFIYWLPLKRLAGVGYWDGWNLLSRAKTVTTYSATWAEPIKED